MLIPNSQPISSCPLPETGFLFKIFSNHISRLPRCLSSKEATCQYRRRKRRGFDPCIRKICSRKWQPSTVFLPGKSHGQRSLVGYSPWGCKELDMTEHIHTQIIYHRHCGGLEGWGQYHLSDFPGDPMVKTTCSQCRGPGFDPSSGN